MLRIQEKILLYQIKRGNRVAFSRFYHEYVDKIQRFVLFKISNKEKVEELTNAIFVKTLNYLLGGKEIKNFRAFLYQTARNLIIDFYREKGMKEISLGEVAEIPTFENINEKVDQKIEIEKIKKHLSFLKPEHQEIILLRFFEGLPFRDVAQITGQKEATARMIAHRGIKELKKQLKLWKSDLDSATM